MLEHKYMCFFRTLAYSVFQPFEAGAYRGFSFCQGIIIALA